MAADGCWSLHLRDHVDPLAAFLDEVVLHNPICNSKKGVIPADLDVQARMNPCAALPDENIARAHNFAAELLDAQALRVAITTVAARTAAFLMRHCSLLAPYSSFFVEVFLLEGFFEAVEELFPVELFDALELFGLEAPFGSAFDFEALPDLADGFADVFGAALGFFSVFFGSGAAVLLAAFFAAGLAAWLSAFGGDSALASLAFELPDTISLIRTRV